MTTPEQAQRLEAIEKEMRQLDKEVGELQEQISPLQEKVAVKRAQIDNLSRNIIRLASPLSN